MLLASWWPQPALANPITPVKIRPEALERPVTLLEAQSQVRVVRLVDGQSMGRTELYTLPLDWDTVDASAWTKPHHDYPAVDLLVPVGTPVFAITNGQVTFSSPNDGSKCGGAVRITTLIGEFLYCHLSSVVIKSGSEVRTGDLIGYSGGKPGSRGAGSSTVPHLHLEVFRGKRVCPQPFLISILNGEEPDLGNVTNCFY